MLGEMNLNSALDKATSMELDLVEVSPKSKVPVCKIMDYGQFVYQQKKTDQQNKKDSTLYF